MRKSISHTNEKLSRSDKHSKRYLCALAFAIAEKVRSQMFAARETKPFGRALSAPVILGGSHLIQSLWGKLVAVSYIPVAFSNAWVLLISDRMRKSVILTAILAVGSLIGLLNQSVIPFAGGFGFAVTLLCHWASPQEVRGDHLNQLAVTSIGLMSAVMVVMVTYRGSIYS